MLQSTGYKPVLPGETFLNEQSYDSVRVKHKVASAGVAAPDNSHHGSKLGRLRQHMNSFVRDKGRHAGGSQSKAGRIKRLFIEEEDEDSRQEGNLYCQSNREWRPRDRLPVVDRVIG